MEILKKRQDFLAAAQTELRFVSPAFILQKRIRPEKGPVRFGFTASRKVGGAVERNRAKRRLRALARSPVLSPTTGADYVLIARHASLSRTFSLMEKELENAVRYLARKA